jgi:hypothetical protein
LKDLADDSFPVMTNLGMKLFFKSKKGFHREGILLGILENQGGIIDRKIFREGCHHPQKIVLEMGLRWEMKNLVEAL